MQTVIVILLTVIGGLTYRMVKERRNLDSILSVLKEIEDGNLDRKLIVKENTKQGEMCYRINQIVSNNKQQLMRLEQSERTYRQLMTSLSHDVRTPMASMMGYLSAVCDDVVEQEEREEFLKLSLEKAEVLKQYVDTLFEWMKLESGEQRYEFVRVDINELTREILVEWIPQFEQQQMDYDIDIGEAELWVSLDESSFRRILYNLIQNVFQHSQSKKIAFSILDKEDQVELHVKDFGIGIQEKDLPHIFERLYRCDTARSGKGSGLGLSIVAELVKANGGTIRAESTTAIGTTFVITFIKN